MTAAIVFAAAMMTKWGAEVTEANAWTLYPRPQMVRENWTNLNGLWEYSILTNDYSSFDVETTGKILVPFCFESPLSGVERIVNTNDTMLYRRTFSCRREKGRRTLLNFEAVDWRAHVFVNGVEAGLPHEGGNLPFSYDITDLVKDGENKLEVYVWDPTHTFINAGGKQSDVSKGCFYTRVSGIWQTVWLESVPETYIEDFAVTPDIDKGEARLSFSVKGEGGEVEVEVFDGEDPAAKKVASGRVRGGAVLALAIPAPVRLWSPESPNLYSFKARIGADEVRGYFGMRKFSKAKDLKGRWRFMLNNKPFFPYGTLDQGWWPDGLLTPPSEEAMAFDIKTLKDCGFNMMRKHIKVEPRRYYALCDRLGLVVFQDAPSPAGAGNIFSFQKNLQRYGMFRREWKEEMDHLMKVPSICVWIPYNEGWGQPDARLTAATLRWTKAYDPTRLVDGPSGWFDFEGGDPGKRFRAAFSREAEDPSCDIVDHHVYRGPGQSANRRNRISLLGEFGGLGHPVEGHLWANKASWGYGGVADTSTPEGLMKVYEGLLKKLGPMVDDGLAGAIYTQTTDVEQEINGILTYDRKVLKFDAKKLKELHDALVSRGEAFEAAPDCVLLDL